MAKTRGSGTLSNRVGPEPAAEQAIPGLGTRIGLATTLSPKQLREATVMLAHTFDDSPLFRSAFPVPGRRTKAARTIFAALLEDGMRFGRVHLAYAPEIVGALIWYPPGSYPMSVARKARLALGSRLMLEFARIAATDPFGLHKFFRAQSMFDSVHPTRPHCYACFLGVAVGRHGQRVGKDLADCLITEAQQRQLPIYCETQERSNVDWFLRLGFQILHEGLEAFPGGPLTWTMWREPRPG